MVPNTTPPPPGIGGRPPQTEAARLRILTVSGIVLVFLAAHLYAAATAFVPLPPRALVLFAGLLLLIPAAILRHPDRARGVEVLLVGCSLVCLHLATTVLRGYPMDGINLYTGLLAGFLLYRADLPAAKTVLICIFGLSLAVQVQERLTESFFYVANSATGYGLLDVQFFRGWVGTFRAKGFFEGPLTASGFAISIAFLFRHSPTIVAACFVSSALASGRLAMAVTASILVMSAFKARRVYLFFLAALIAAIATWILTLFLDAADYERFWLAFDITSSANSARWFYMSWGLDFIWADNTVSGMLLGRPYDSRVITGGVSFENDVIQMLADGGLVVFLVYLGTYAYLARKHLTRLSEAPDFMLLFLVMMIFPYTTSLGLNINNWLFFFALAAGVTDRHPSRVLNLSPRPHRFGIPNLAQ